MHLVVSEYGLSVGKTSERVTIRREGKVVGETPVEDVESLLLASEGISISTDVLEMCAARGVPVTFLRRDGEPYARLSSALAGGDVGLRQAQLEARHDQRGVRLAIAFVTGKLRNQSANLVYFGRSRPGIALLATARKHIDALAAEAGRLQAADCEQARVPLVALEAQAAKHYWEAIAAILPPTLAFPGRERRGATDPVNQALNYGYGILYSQVWAQLVIVGLDPFCGYVHVDRVNAPTLVFDFIEEYRQAVVDRPVLGWLLKGGRPVGDGGGLSWETRRRLAELVLGRLNSAQAYGGKQVRLLDVMRAEAYEVAAAVRGQREHDPWLGSW